jgi:hypothetical protein
VRSSMASQIASVVGATIFTCAPRRSSAFQT